MERPRLRDLPYPLRLAVACFLLVVLGGYAAGLYYMAEHHGKKDGDDALSWRDLVGLYHGAEVPPPLLSALDDPDHVEVKETIPAAELEVLKRWLDVDYERTDRREVLKRGFEDPPLDQPADALVPIDVLYERCDSCHGPQKDAGHVPLATFDQVADHAFGQTLTPLSPEILAVSTHTHALGMAPYTLLVAAVFFFASFGRALRHLVILGMTLGLLLDLGGMWLARLTETGVAVMVGGGALTGFCLCLGLGLSLLELLFFPRRPRS